ncbi:nuclear transport factor 2 family protein [Acidisphaera rubrifaciens]|uniref:Nuclear transport factor 2 family protein n=1 Tax=Acidisphaera rubrifaciens HS-AP3 TaxID=1231350 RepID=A0A0D6P8B2_9PROT|nr:nuclear transport factor 2 family protein [Acidisphaera rubrifaciens]GAN77581.1 hypothetical protein Asru_0384_03 [Acidisphaera rubrifaciens HS-AP3]
MDDVHPARAVVARYMEMSGRLDAEGLAACFAPQAGLHGHLGAKVLSATAEAYVADVRRLAAAQTSMTAYQAEMVEFAATGGIARATVRMDGFAGRGFVDYLHLMEQDGTWRIVGKTFTTL